MAPVITGLYGNAMGSIEPRKMQRTFKSSHCDDNDFPT